MSEDLKFDVFTTKGWKAFEDQVERFLPTEEMMRRAVGSCCLRMSNWLRTKAARELPSKLGIPRKVINNRFRSFRIRGEIRGGKLWMGLNGVPYIKLRPVRDSKGVRTRDGDYLEEGAFLAIVRSTGKMAVFKRVEKGRYPLEVPEASVSDPCLIWLRQQVNHPEFRRFFYERLEKEIQWRATGT